jgi:hypothetical protein
LALPPAVTPLCLEGIADGAVGWHLPTPFVTPVTPSRDRGHYRRRDPFAKMQAPPRSRDPARGPAGEGVLREVTSRVQRSDAAAAVLALKRGLATLE